MSRGDLPVIDPATFGDADDRTRKNVVGVILAAGTSERYGDENKLLATVGGEPIVRRAVRPFVEDELADVAVVLGHEAPAVRPALDGLDVTFLENPDYEAGQSTSVREGTRYGRESGADAIVFGLGDMPHLRARSIALVRETYERGQGEIVAAAYDGGRGNPVLFAANHFDALAAVEGDTGGRRLILESDDAVCVETRDPGVLRDVNRPDDHP